MKDNGKMTYNMAMEQKHELMDLNLKDNIKEAKKMEKDSTLHNFEIMPILYYKVNLIFKYLIYKVICGLINQNMMEIGRIIK